MSEPDECPTCGGKGYTEGGESWVAPGNARTFVCPDCDGQSTPHPAPGSTPESLPEPAYEVRVDDGRCVEQQAITRAYKER